MRYRYEAKIITVKKGSLPTEAQVAEASSTTATSKQLYAIAMLYYNYEAEGRQKAWCGQYKSSGDKCCHPESDLVTDETQANKLVTYAVRAHDKGFLAATNLLGAYYHKLKKYREAISYFSDYLEKGGKSPDVYYNLGITYGDGFGELETANTCYVLAYLGGSEDSKTRLKTEDFELIEALRPAIVAITKIDSKLKLAAFYLQLMALYKAISSPSSSAKINPAQIKIQEDEQEYFGFLLAILCSGSGDFSCLLGSSAEKRDEKVLSCGSLASLAGKLPEEVKAQLASVVAILVDRIRRRAHLSTIKSSLKPTPDILIARRLFESFENYQKTIGPKRFKEMMEAQKQLDDARGAKAKDAVSSLQAWAAGVPKTAPVDRTEADLARKQFTWAALPSAAASSASFFAAKVGGTGASAAPADGIGDPVAARREDAASSDAAANPATLVQSQAQAAAIAGAGVRK